MEVQTPVQPTAEQPRLILTKETGRYVQSLANLVEISNSLCESVEMQALHDEEVSKQLNEDLKTYVEPLRGYLEKKIIESIYQTFEEIEPAPNTIFA